MKLGKKLALSLALTGAFALAACGPDAVDEGNNGNGNDAQEQQDQQLQGSVAIDGSSTVYPIMEAVAEEYQAEQQDVQVSVGVSGTGGGFKAFAAGETQISNASRPIKDEEKAALEEAGIEYTELELAYDGISIVVNKDNDWVDQLTVDELKNCG